MPFDRRHVLTRAGLGLAAGLGWVAAAHAKSKAAGPDTSETKAPLSPNATASLGDLGISLIAGHDNSAAVQAAIDQASTRGVGLRFPPGTYAIGRPLTLRTGTALAGGLGATRLVFGAGAGLTANKANGIRIEDLILDGANQPISSAAGLDAILSLQDCGHVRLAQLDVHDGRGNGLVLKGCSGSITACRVHGLRRAGIFVLDGTGVEIARNHVHDCGDNGILAWTSKAAELGALIQANRIERIAARSGGTGQNGNGVNVYRAGGVLVSDNRISDCAYSAIRANGASNIQMISNSCARIGEVALYAEFAFEGALIANNLVDGAASGISVTNFNEGGRLAVVQGNLIRSLVRREHEPEDKRGEGISVEADTVVANNVIEGAPSAGIFIGWDRHMREVSVTGNLVRQSRIGIAVQAGTSQPASKAAQLLASVTGRAAQAGRPAPGPAAGPVAGRVLIANNMISGTRDGAIRTLRLHTPFGADLAQDAASPFAHITCAGNVAA
jgi:uncharacterized secreted repeat protein (TIGR03808 family)